MAVPDFYGDKELAVVTDALKLSALEPVALLRHSAAVAVAFQHSQGPVPRAVGRIGRGAALLPEGAEQRIVGFVDVGSSHGTVTVVKYSRKAQSGFTYYRTIGL